MRKINSFTFISINGFFKGLHEDISWHQHGDEENQYSVESLEAANILLFGRKTYEMMYSFWHSPMAAELYPEVAEGMNKAEKIVFSNTLQSVEWQNTKVIGGNIIEQIKKIKETEGKDMTILGSGSILTQFSNASLIDIYDIMIDPVAIGQGQQIFSGSNNKIDLKLISTRELKSSGVILIKYERKRA